MKKKNALTTLSAIDPNHLRRRSADSLPPSHCLILVASLGLHSASATTQAQAPDGAIALLIALRRRED